MRSILIAASVATALMANPASAQDSPEKPSAQEQEKPPVGGFPLIDPSKSPEEQQQDLTKLLEDLQKNLGPIGTAVMDRARQEREARENFDTSRPVVGFGISKAPAGMKIDVLLEGSAADSAGLEKDMVILRINGISLTPFETAEVVKILGAIDGEIIFDVEGRGRYSLIKAPIPQAAE